MSSGPGGSVQITHSSAGGGRSRNFEVTVRLGQAVMGGLTFSFDFAV
jgi:hypothetical protein